MSRKPHAKVRGSDERVILSISLKVDNTTIIVPPQDYLKSLKIDIPSQGVGIINVSLFDQAHSGLAGLASGLRAGSSTFTFSVSRDSADSNYSSRQFTGVITDAKYEIKPTGMLAAITAIQSAGAIFKWNASPSAPTSIAEGTKLTAALDIIKAHAGWASVSVSPQLVDAVISTPIYRNPTESLNALIDRMIANVVHPKTFEKVYIRYGWENGRTTAIVSTRESWVDSITHSYRVIDVDGEVISFTPNLNSLAAAYAGAANAIVLGTDQTAGRTSAVAQIANDSSINAAPAKSIAGNEKVLDTGPFSPTQELVLSDPAIRGVCTDGKTMELLEKARRGLTGTLVVRGTHDVEPFDRIALSYRPFNMDGDTFLSGTYTVLSLSHSIVGGAWYTTFNLVSEHLSDKHPDGSRLGTVTPRRVESAVTSESLETRAGSNTSADILRGDVSNRGLPASQNFNNSLSGFGSGTIFGGY